jgi:hypothetical protein
VEKVKHHGGVLGPTYVSAPRLFPRLKVGETHGAWPGASPRSLHYCGLALDIGGWGRAKKKVKDPTTGKVVTVSSKPKDGILYDPETNRGRYFLRPESDEKHWRIYCRVPEDRGRAEQIKEGAFHCVDFYKLLDHYQRSLGKTFFRDRKKEQDEVKRVDAEIARQSRKRNPDPALIGKLTADRERTTRTLEQRADYLEIAEQGERDDCYYKIPAGLYLDLTQLIEEEGTFRRISAHDDWKVLELGWEWWHFSSNRDFRRDGKPVPRQDRPTLLDLAELIGYEERFLASLGYTPEVYDGLAG